MTPDLYLIAVILGGHGLKGEAKLKFFGESIKTLKTYSHLWLDQERALKIESMRPFKPDVVIVKFSELTTLTQIEALRHQKLYLKNDQLPPLHEDETYYVSHLIGCDVETLKGEYLGEILSLENYGAGDILECGNLRFPFTKVAVPTVDIKAKKIIVDTAYVIRDDEA